MPGFEFPLQIGLIGAPDSGKQAVAERFAEISADWFAEHGSVFEIIENAGTTIEREADEAMGLFGSYHEDLRAYFVRYEAEEEARRSGNSWITLGTVIDNIAHCGINLENIMTGLTTPDQEQRQQRQQVTMTMLTFLLMERFRYLFGFYLPYQGTNVVLPGQPEPSNYPNRVDMGIRSIFANFGMRVQILDQVTVEEQAQMMFETVSEIMENGPPEVAKEPVEESLSTPELSLPVE